MKKLKIIKMYEDFILKNKVMKEEEIKESFKSLEYCYNKPSQEKRSIYNYYYNLLISNSDYVEEFGIKSYNTFMITLHSIIIKDNIKYYVLITPAKNIIFKMED